MYYGGYASFNIHHPKLAFLDPWKLKTHKDMGGSNYGSLLNQDLTIAALEDWMIGQGIKTLYDLSS
jgi:hypothetical protein